MESLLAAFLLIFVAEMGDKTQLMAMTFTTRFKVSQVIIAISAATVLNNFIAVIAGTLLSEVFPVSIIQNAAYFLFIVFGIWTLSGSEDDEENAEKKVVINPFFTVAIFFFISEFGDKTQIATMTLSMKYGAPLNVLIGASLGMICANLIGIGVGVLIGKKVPAHIIKWVAAVIFIIFGMAGFWTVFYGKFGLKQALIFETLILFATAAAVAVIFKKGKKKK